MLFSTILSRALQVPLLFQHDRSTSGVPKQGDIIVDDSVKSTSPLTTEFDDIVKANLDFYKIPGLAVAIVQGNQTFAKGYGISSFPDTPVTPDTIFYGASTTKAFTAAAVALYLEDINSKLSWRTPLYSLIPDDFVTQDDFTTLHATLEDLASHRTGIPRHDTSLISGSYQTVRDVVRSLRHLPLTKPFRTTYQYSNHMYVTLGYVVQNLTGIWLGDYLSQRVWQPLGMTSSFFSLDDALASGKPLAHGYYWDEPSSTFKVSTWFDESYELGAGALMSTVNDYAKWVHAMIYQATPLSKEIHKELISPRTIIGKGEDGVGIKAYALGWDVESYHGFEIISHDGATIGFGTKVLYIPAKKWGCIMLANSALTSNMAEDVLTWSLIDDLLEIPEAKRTNRTAINERSLAKTAHMRNHTYARTLYYPPSETSHLPATLPIPDYAGSYTHPAYGHWTLEYSNATSNSIANGTLHMGNDTGFGIIDVDFEHVTEDYFFVSVAIKEYADTRQYSRAQFRIGADGRVKDLGVGLEEAMGNEVIWFERIEQNNGAQALVR